MSLRRLSTLTPAELDKMAALRASVDFGVPPYQWTPQEDRPVRVLVWDGDRLVGQLALLEREVRVGSAPVKVAGVAGVMTAPDARGRGYASAAMERAAEYMRVETDAAFGLLVCLDSRVRLYERLGWRLIPEGAVAQQPSGQITVEMNAMSLSLRGEPLPRGQVDFAGLPW